MQAVENIRNLIGSNIKLLRKAKDWTQTDLAENAGVSFRAVQNIEAGTRTPRPDTIRAIAEALGVNERDLVAKPPRGNQNETDPTRMSDAELIAQIVTILPTLDKTKLATLFSAAANLVAIADDEADVVPPIPAPRAKGQ